MCVCLCVCVCVCVCVCLCVHGRRTSSTVAGRTTQSSVGSCVTPFDPMVSTAPPPSIITSGTRSVCLCLSRSLRLFYVCLSASLCSVVSADCVVQGPRTGCRKLVNTAGRQCRIHTYGDSFTHCDQVSDAETWQEYLAAHLQEPVENYGVGGYSVYQAYLRMRSVEATHPARYVVLNVWDDDSFRNIDAWRTIRFGSTYSSQLSSLAAARFCIVFLYWINC
eukprot:COSAG03_NODE_3596_length_1929_cov_15.327869_2_plen_221_part_00